jgi:LysM repeat protein
MDNMVEMNLEEMEEVVGGKGGSPKKLPKRNGFVVYQIQRGDTLTRIAYRYDTTVNELMQINRTLIKNKNDITAGYYIYVPA